MFTSVTDSFSADTSALLKAKHPGGSIAKDRF